MNEKEFFGKDLLKSMSKTSKLHADYCASLKESKSILKRNFNKDTLDEINEAFRECAFDEDVNEMNIIIEKVKTGNFDDNDFEILKALIIPYLDNIVEKLANNSIEK